MLTKKQKQGRFLLIVTLIGLYSLLVLIDTLIELIC